MSPVLEIESCLRGVQMCFVKLERCTSCLYTECKTKVVFVYIFKDSIAADLLVCIAMEELEDYWPMSWWCWHAVARHWTSFRDISWSSKSKILKMVTGQKNVACQDKSNMISKMPTLSQESSYLDSITKITKILELWEQLLATTRSSILWVRHHVSYEVISHSAFSSFQINNLSPCLIHVDEQVQVNYLESLCTQMTNWVCTLQHTHCL